MLSNTDGKFQGPLFIVGMQRSGTKLLREFLSNHSRVLLTTEETGFIPYLLARLEHYGDLRDSLNFQAMHAALAGFPYFIYQKEKGRPVEANDWHRLFLQELRAGFETDPSGALLKSLVLADNIYSGASEGVIWGDKSPAYRTEIPLLKRHFPKAKFIHIVRDVRDNALSINRGWNKSLLRSAQRWRDETARAQEDGRQLGEDFIELRYEDLVTNPVVELQRLCEFLLIDFEPEMPVLTRITEDVGAAKGQVGLLRDNFNKYQEELGPKTLLAIESIAKPQMEAYGYQLVNEISGEKRLGSVENLFYRYSDYLRILGRERRTRGTLSTLRFFARNYLPKK